MGARIRNRSGSDGDADNLLWDKMSRSTGFGEAPQQAFLRPSRAAKIASVATLALLAVSALPQNSAKNGGACFSYASSVFLTAFTA